MDSPTLVRMALRIADYYAGYPAAEARAGVAAHIRRFWSPAMRADLLATWHGWCTNHPDAAAANNAQLVATALDDLGASASS